MAAPTGKGCSPTIRVRVSPEVETALRTVAALQKSTISAVAREALHAVFAGLVDDMGIAQELQRRQDQLGRGGEA